MTQANSDALLEAGLGWAVVPGYDGAHTVPIGDLKPHVIGADCWCQPVGLSKEDPDYDEGSWSHNSMDRREHTIEQGVVQ